jgi:hypothetical protein
MGAAQARRFGALTCRAQSAAFLLQPEIRADANSDSGADAALYSVSFCVPFGPAFGTGTGTGFNLVVA